MRLLADNQAFRTDIQGLRGFAVLAVVLYHASLPVPGGFLGVDIFFVISGFIVTTVMLRELDVTGKVSLRDFYVRRIRRILPMFTLVTVVTILLTMVFLSPFGDQQQAFSTSRWSAFFASNYQLQLSDSYQNLVGNPFRHMWSLSVEEQFYVVLPIVLILSVWLFRRSSDRTGRWRGAFVGVTSALALVSFALALDASASEATATMAFFSLPTRAWELCIGVLAATAFSSLRLGRAFASVLGVGGFVALTFSLFLIDDSTTHPGWVTLAPVVGTAILILVGSQSAVTHWVLSCKPLVWLGDRSYGWYLWHWPFVVFAGAALGNRPMVLAVASVLALLITEFTFRVVEQPTRRAKSVVGFRATAVLVGSMLVVASSSFAADRVTGTGLGLREGNPDEFDFTEQFELVKRGGNMDGSCFLDSLFTSFNDVGVVARECSNKVRSSTTDVVLIGDSNALTASDGLFEATRQLGVRSVFFGGGGCPSLSRPPMDKSETCAPVQQMYRRLVEEVDPRVVVLVNRYDLYVEPLAGVIDNDHRIPFADGKTPVRPRQRLESVARALEEFVDELVRDGRQVVVMLQPPPSYLLNRTLFESWFPQAAIFRDSDVANVVEQRREIREAIISVLAGREGISVFEPGEAVCGRADFCQANIDDELVYANLSHLNPKGSMRLTEGFIGVLKPLLSN